MFEDLIAQLDEMGVPYTEGENDLTIDISGVDKADLVDIIIMLNNSGETFDITEDSITVTSSEPVETTEGEEAESPNYMEEALGQL